MSWTFIKTIRCITEFKNSKDRSKDPQCMLKLSFKPFKFKARLVKFWQKRCENRKIRLFIKNKRKQWDHKKRIKVFKKRKAFWLKDKSVGVLRSDYVSLTTLKIRCITELRILIHVKDRMLIPSMAQTLNSPNLPS